MSMFLKETLAGFNATRMLVALRWRMVRSSAVKSAIVFGGLFFFFGLSIVVNMGYAAQLAALQQQNAQGIYARLWAESLSAGTMLNVGAFALAGALAVALFAPFTGTSTLALNPTEDMEGLRLPRTHRFFDSFLINFISGLGLLQLLVLTAVASLVTMDGLRGPAILTAGALWVFVISLMTATGWILEWSARKFGHRNKNLFGIFVFLLIVLAIVADPRHGETLFGLAPLFLDTLRSSVLGWSSTSFLAPSIVLVSSVPVILLGLVATRAALAMPPRSNKMGKVRKNKNVSKYPTVTAFQILNRTIWRTSEVRKPILGLLLVGSLIAAIVPLGDNVEFSLIAVAPLTVGLSWSLNVFGLLGSGNVWLASQPKIMDRLPWVALVLQLIMSFAITVILWGISLGFGHTTIESLGRVVGGGLISIVACAILSLFFSIAQPHRTRLSGRGDALLPPLAALGYLLALLLIGPAPVSFMFVTEEPLQGQLVAALIPIISLAFLATSARMWANPVHRSKVIAITSVA